VGPTPTIGTLATTMTEETPTQPPMPR
jgi:hypothetical protein